MDSDIGKRRRCGFTTVEVVIVVGISVIVIGGAMANFVNMQRLLWRQSQWNELQENLRAAASVMAADIRMAGYGLPVAETQVVAWVDWAVGVTSRVVVTQGVGSAPDSLSLVGAFKGPVSRLTAAADPGDTMLMVSPPAKPLNTSDRKLLFVRGVELVRVTSVMMDGQQLYISAHPTKAGVGLANGYPTGTPLELVEVVTYTCQTNTASFPGRPYLARDDHQSGGGPLYQYMIAAGIENLQVVKNSNAVTVTLGARTRDPEPGYTDPVHGDHHRHAERVLQARPRNPIH
jgi:type II secretory pathway pseudopilin PulG